MVLLRILRAFWGCGPLVIATAALTFAFTALVVKFIGDSIPPFETLSCSGLLCLFGLTGFLTHIPLLPRTPDYSKMSCENVILIVNNCAVGSAPAKPLTVMTPARVTFLTLLRAAFGTLATASFYLSLEVLSLKDAVTLFFTSPVFACLLDWLVMGRRPGLGAAAATALTLAGTLLVTQPPFLFPGASSDAQGLPSPNGVGAPSGHPPLLPLLTSHNAAPVGWAAPPAPADPAGTGLDPVGVALALVAAAANASGFLTVNLLRGRQHPLALTWWYNLVLAVATALPLAFHWPLAPKLPTAHGALLLGAVGATQLAAQLCLNRGFQLESAGRGAAINVLQVLFSFVLDVAVMGDTPSILSVAGSSLVAAGVLFVALDSSEVGQGKTGSFTSAVATSAPINITAASTTAPAPECATGCDGRPLAARADAALGRAVLEGAGAAAYHTEDVTGVATDLNWVAGDEGPGGPRPPGLDEDPGRPCLRASSREAAALLAEPLLRPEERGPG